MKEILIKLRTFIKFSLLIFISIFLIVGAVFLIYKPIYSVSLNGELIGYSADKSKLQSRINDFIENGDDSVDKENLAFVYIDNMPTYTMCLLKRGITTNDDEIFQKITELGTPYYKYYAIIEEDVEKVYVSNFDDAKKIITELRDQNSGNIKNISILEKYETKTKKFTNVDVAVNKLYEEKKIPTSDYYNYSVSTARNLSSAKVNLGITLSRPIYGTISSRFGSISRVRSGAHTGLDIAAPYGTKIKAAAAGTVVHSGWKGALGKMIAIYHGNGVMTYYGHCSSLYVSEGQKVSRGSVIGAVGSTGNSTGNHLHLEVRVNGVAYNPQNYVY